jgi:hypothetical protein
MYVFIETVLKVSDRLWFIYTGIILYLKTEFVAA